MTLQSAAKQLADAIAADLAKTNAKVADLHAQTVAIGQTVVDMRSEFEQEIHGLKVEIARIQGRIPPNPPDPTKPLPSPVPEPEPTPPSTGWLAREPKADAHKLSANAREQDLADALKSGRDVLLKAEASYGTHSTLRMTAPGQLLGVWGEGNRPLLAPAGFRDAQALLDIVGARNATVSGIRMEGVEKTLAIYVGPGCDDLLLEDIDIDGFTDGVKMLGGELWATGQRVHRCIIRNLIRRQSHEHTTGIYVEGSGDLRVSECAFDNIGMDNPTQWRRAIYVQTKSKNGLVHLDGNLFHECAAEAFQLRSGGTATDNLILRCLIESYAHGRTSAFDGNVVMYGASGLYMYGVPYAGFKDNVFAHGVKGYDGWTQHALRVDARDHSLENNRFYDWQDSAGNIMVGGDKTKSLQPKPNASNRVLDSLEHGDMQAVVDAAVNRPRGVWSDDIATAVNAVQGAAR